MQIDPTAATLAAIQGSPAGILLILLVYTRDRALGETQIATIANRSAKTVRASLATLHNLGLAQRHARYNGWTATARLRQMMLGELPQSEREILPLPPSSGFQPGDPDTSSYITTTTTSEREILPLGEAPWPALLELLTHHCAADPKAARRALDKAHARGETQEAVRFHILAWLSYCLSEHGQGINNIGALITARLEDAIPPPSWHTPELDGPLGAELRRLSYAQLGFLT